MQSGSKRPVDVARLKADIAAARIELFSPHCAADRIRLRYSPQDIVHFGERSDLKSFRFRRRVVPFFLSARGPISSGGRAVGRASPTASWKFISRRG